MPESRGGRLGALRGAFFTLMGRIRGLPAGAASHLELIHEHTESILGPCSDDLHEKYSPDLHIDLLHWAPNPERDFHYLVTSGMSDRPMPGCDTNEELLELVMALPPHWDVSPSGFSDPAVWEPVRLLKRLARYPHRNQTFFAKTHTIQLADQPQLFPMKAALLMPPVLVRELAEPLPLTDGRAIHFLAVYLIRQDELDLKLGGGLCELLEAFGEHYVTEIYDLQRPSVLI